MTCVYIYGGEATYSGNAEFEWKSPSVGGRHNYMLFLGQEHDSSQDGAARAELAKFGFVEIEMTSGRPIKVESLNEPKMHAFHRHYEGAFEEGSSLVWYPQDLRESRERS